MIIAAAVAGKFIGSAAAARFVKQSWRDSLIIGSLMNTRGLMELVVLNIGYDIGVLSPQIFAMMVIMALVTTCMTGPALDLIDRFMPYRKDDPAYSQAEAQGFSILIAFASPQGGRKMLRLANNLIQPEASQTVTALHLSPSSYLNQVNTDEYQYETFRPIHEEGEILRLPVAPLFKPSQNIEHDIIETANEGNYDLLIMGVGHRMFEGTILGKVLGITTRIISPVRLFDTITGKGKLFNTDIFDERTSHIIKSVRMPVAILIEKKLTRLNDIFIPVFSENDQFLFRFATRMLHHPNLKITVMDPSGLADQQGKIKKNLNALQMLAPGRVIINNEKAMEKEFLQKQDLLMISYESWRQAVESHSIWLSCSPSVLVVRG